MIPQKDHAGLISFCTDCKDENYTVAL